MKKGVIAIILAIVVVGGIAAAVMVMNKDKTNNNTSSSTDTGSNSNNNNSSNSNTTPVATDAVSIENFAFSPDSITVKKGTTVTWTNNDTTSHTVTSDSGNTMSSDTLGRGDTYQVTFNEAGTFSYHCNFHSDMHGTVTVTE